MLQKTMSSNDRSESMANEERRSVRGGDSSGNGEPPAVDTLRLGVCDNGGISSQAMIDIRELLECPVCLKIIYDPPVFRCDNDHAICGSCHDRLTTGGARRQCPVCRGSLDNKRSRVLETIVSQFPKTKCKYFPACSFARTDPDLIKQHETEDCPHRPVPCYTCPPECARVPLSSMTDHLLERHGKCSFRGEFGKSEVWQSEFGQNASFPLLIDGDRGQLTFYVNRVMHQGRVLFWVSHDQTKKDDEVYQYTVSILCGKAKREEGKTLRLVKQKTFCVSSDVTHDEVKSAILVLNISEWLAKQSMNDKGRFEFELMIERAEFELFEPIEHFEGRRRHRHRRRAAADQPAQAAAAAAPVAGDVDFLDDLDDDDDAEEDEDLIVRATVEM